MKNPKNSQILSLTSILYLEKKAPNKYKKESHKGERPLFVKYISLLTKVGIITKNNIIEDNNKIDCFFDNLSISKFIKGIKKNIQKYALKYQTGPSANGKTAPSQSFTVQ